jgi:uncharacterized protein YceK
MNNKTSNPANVGDNKTIIIAVGVVLIFLLIVCLTLWLPFLCGELGLCGGNGNGGFQTSPCEDLLARALETYDQGCQMIGSNQVCYGNFDVSAQLTEGDISQFSALGDTIPVNRLKTLNTAPMDLDQDIWGIAVFKLQANMEGTIPGQNVTFLVFGDTGLYNYSGDLYSIYFSTGIGSVTCSQVPDGLKVDVPEGSGIVFTANGAEIALEGDSVLTANPGENMSVTLLNGTGSVTSDGVTQDFHAGQYVNVPLSENLESQGPPSIPLDLPGDAAYELCLLSGEECDEDDPLAWLTPTSGVLVLGGIWTDTPMSGEPTNTLLPGQPTYTYSPGQPTNPPNPGAPTATSGGSNPVPPTDPPPTTEPPTNTPIPATCGNISLGGYSTSGNTVSLTVTNNNQSEVVIDRVQLSWDQGANGDLDTFLINDRTLWGVGGATTSSPANLPLSANIPHRTISPGGSVTLHFEFVDGSSALNSLNVYFNIGCSKSK